MAKQSQNQTGRSWSKTFVAGIVGAGATIAVTLIIGVLGYMTHFFEHAIGHVAMDAVIHHVTVEMRPGLAEFNKDDRTADKWSYFAKCQRDELLLGGSCIITSEDGYLQSEGIEHRKDGSERYVCKYSKRADPDGVRALVLAACLKYESLPQSN